MELTDTLKSLFIETAKTLKGSARRLFMGRTVKELPTVNKPVIEAMLCYLDPTHYPTA